MQYFRKKIYQTMCRNIKSKNLIEKFLDYKFV